MQIPISASIDPRGITLGAAQRALAMCLTLGGCVATSMASAQSGATIQISSPSNGATVAPGESLTVSIVSSTGAQFQRVLIGGFDDLKEATALPATVALAVPLDARLGVYYLNVLGLTTSGQEVKAEPVLVHVEKSGAPVSLSVDRTPIAFSHPGIRQSLLLSATFADGTAAEISESPRLTFTTSNADVAHVDANGFVTAVAAGTAVVTVSYAALPLPIRLTIPVTVGHALLTASPSAIDFGEQLIGVSSSRTLSLTNSAPAPLDIFEIKSTPEFAAQSDCVASSPLAPEGTCSITITFTPAAPGPRRSMVRIENAAFSPPLGISMSGVGLGLRASATSVASSVNPSVLGQAVSFTASVTDGNGGPGLPTGAVSFVDNSTTLGFVDLGVAGLATLVAPDLGVGGHQVTAAYSGDSGFIGSVSPVLTQVVRYAAAGTACRGEPGHQILQPVNSDGTSVFNQGRTVPAKFRVCNSAGQSVGAPGVVQDFRLTQVISGTTSDVNENVPSTTPDTTFRWDAGAEQWIFNISTISQLAQRTYVYTVTLNDGTTITFRYGLR